MASADFAADQPVPNVTMTNNSPMSCPPVAPVTPKKLVQSWSIGAPKRVFQRGVTGRVAEGSFEKVGRLAASVSVTACFHLAK